MSAERIENIRNACADLPEQLHQYYRLATFQDATSDFLGAIWNRACERMRDRTHSYNFQRAGLDKCPVSQPRSMQ
jgi:hypothetical protein